jgi:CRISPR system Cascade subunit CasA
MLKAGRSELPDGEDDWRELIRGLTPDWPEDEPWSLVVEDVSKPALLQPPVPREEFSAWKNKEDNWCYTPDELDTAVTTSKAHDLKRAVQAVSSIEDWLYALLSFQTQTHYGGRGWYGAARGPQGFLNRVFIGFSPSKDAALIEKSQHFIKDVKGWLTYLEFRDAAPFMSDPAFGIT